MTAKGEGEITSGTFAPTLAKSIGMARVPLGVATGDIIDVGIRDKTLKARVTKMPFARNGKSLLN